MTTKRAKPNASALGPTPLYHPNHPYPCYECKRREKRVGILEAELEEEKRQTEFAMIAWKAEKKWQQNAERSAKIWCGERNRLDNENAELKARVAELEGPLMAAAKYHKEERIKLRAQIGELECRLARIADGDFDGDVAAFAAKPFEARERGSNQEVGQ